MTNIPMLPVVGVDHKENLSELIEHWKKYCPFDVEWDDHSWNVTGKCKSKPDKAHKQKYLHFTRDNGKPLNAKSSMSEMLPFHNKELSDIAKCHICSMQTEAKGGNGLVSGSLQNVINAYRYLDLELSQNFKGVNALSNRNFVKALQIAVNKLEDSTAYRIGTQLQNISSYIDEKRLTCVKTKYKAPILRQDTQVPSDTKIDQKNSIERHKKMPDKEVLKAVGLLSSQGIGGDFGLFLSLVEIQFATGFREGEIFTLSTDCLYLKEEEEFNELTGEYDIVSDWEVKYHAEKKGGWHTKVLPEAMVPIFRKGFEYILEYLQPVRDVLSEIEKNGSCDFFPALNGLCFTSDQEVYRHIGSSNSNACTKLKKLGVTLEKRKRENPESLGKRKARSGVSFYANELKDITSDRAVESIRNVWSELKDRTTASKLSELLCITQHQRHHKDKSANRWEFCTITDTQYRDFLTGRDTLDNMNSIFEQKNLVLDGVNFRITTHQFRHFLDTLCELSGNISPLEIARYFGRAYMGDNQTYDHTNKTKMVMDNAEEILAANNINKEQAADAAIIFNMVDSEEALDAIRNMATSQVSSIGLCQHDFNDSPCGKHYACLRFCANYKRMKGEQSEIDELTRIKEQQEQHIEEAKEAVAEEYWGANNWLHSHQELLDGCIAALAIEDDDSIPEGSVIQVFPEGKDKCEAIK